MTYPIALNWWNTAYRYTLTAATAPDGTSNAWKLTKKNDGSNDLFRHTNIPFISLGTGTYTFSVRAKSSDTNPDNTFTMDI